MKRVNVYAAIREMREQVVKTMQERGIKEIVTCMSYAEWCKENKREPEDDENDDTDYQDYKNCEAPYAIFFGKYGTGYDYRVDKVTLKQYKTGDPVLMFDCHENELGDDTFGEDELVFMTLYDVYDTLLDRLGIEDEDESREIIVAFGESATDAYDEGFKCMKRVIKNGDGMLLRRKFNSQGEVDAYLLGLEDQVGWESSVPLSASDCERHAKDIEKLIG